MPMVEWILEIAKNQGIGCRPGIILYLTSAPLTTKCLLLNKWKNSILNYWCDFGICEKNIAKY